MSCDVCDRKREHKRKLYQSGRIKTTQRKTERKDYGTATCSVCGSVFAKAKAVHKYCSDDCRRRVYNNRPTYAIYKSKEHRSAKRDWAKKIEADGGIACCLCGGWIAHGEPWHLDHLPGTTEYRGAAHPRCNSIDGAKRSRTASRYNRVRTPCIDCGKACSGERCQHCFDEYRMMQKQQRIDAKPTPTCPDCGTESSRRGVRCRPCGVEHARTLARNYYRTRVGIPLDAPVSERWPGRPRVL